MRIQAYDSDPATGSRRWAQAHSHHRARPVAVSRKSWLCPRKNTMSPFHFLKDQSGAVTVDWTVLAAAIVGLGISAVSAVRTGVIDLGDDIEAALSSTTVASLGMLGGNGWSYSPLYAGITMDWMTGDSGLIAQISAWNYTSTQLQSAYDSYANAARSYISSGNASFAGLMVDHMYAVEQVLANQGARPNDSSTSVQTMYLAVTSM